MRKYIARIVTSRRYSNGYFSTPLLDLISLDLISGTNVFGAAKSNSQIGNRTSRKSLLRYAMQLIAEANEGILGESSPGGILGIRSPRFQR